MVCTVKVLSVRMGALSLDVVIGLMRCFPCLERLYIESIKPGKKNLWRRKHRNLIRSLDIRLKTIDWRYYVGTKSDVDFATFFLLNARVLELMTLQVKPSDFKEEFFTRQREKVQLDKKAS
uniref:FBD domain-containing protein n=1 Tax=Triticum urartu TaxID=4572 RepID=A0A8R7K596_TRIUA